jgi:hypothetical protein
MPDQTLDESALTLATASPFLPDTDLQFAWDSTCLGLLKTCPRLYQLTIIEGWGSRDESIHLRFGIEYHAALELFDRLMAEEDHDREAAIYIVLQKTHLRTADWFPDQSTKAGRYKNRVTLLGLILDYLDHFDPDPAETYIKTDGTPAVELSFRFELDWGPKSSLAQPYLLSGHLDRVVTFNDQLLVMDRKTTTTTLSPYYFAQYEPHNQITLYTLAGRIILNTPIRGVVIDAAQILLEKPNQFARGFTYRTDDQLDEWLDDLKILLRTNEFYTETNHWPMNDTACDKFSGCKFRSCCAKSPGIRDRFLASDFDKLPLEDRWNPLHPR